MNNNLITNTITQIFKTVLLIMVLSLLSMVFAKKDFSLYLFILSLTLILLLIVLFDQYLGFFSSLLLSLFLHFGIYMSITIPFPEMENFYTEFDKTIKASTVLIMLTLRYVMHKKQIRISFFSEVAKISIW